MKKITFKGVFMASLFAFSLTAFAQQTKTEIKNSNVPEHRSCGIEKHYEEMLKNPAYAASFYERQARFQQKLEEIHYQKINGTYQKKATLYIPVAVHFEVGTEADRACLEAYAQTQIDVINEDYTATNADQAALWPAASAYYPGLTPGSVDVQFCIATKNHPAGADPEVLEGSPLVTIGANGSSFGAGFPESDPTYAGYMNFIIKDIGAGLLGYSPLGGSISGGGAVVMNTTCYGTGAGCAGIATPNAPYNLGRTVTHELGHFYNLNHTFIADGGTNCGPADGDGIADTPKVAGSTYGNPANGSVPGCVGGEFSLTMNYMDYVNDASMYMFTPGQATVVEAYFASVAGDWAVDKIDCQGPTFNLAASDLGNCGADTAQTTVNFTALNGFNEVTTFSVTGLPAGAVPSFSPTTLSADGTTTLTVSGLSGVTDGVYPIQIVGTSASVTKNLSIDLIDGTNVCAGQATSAYATSVTRVNFNAIDYTSSLTDTDDASGYSDFTASQSTTVNIDSSYNLTVQVNTDGAYTVASKVWIDWNQNCVFDLPAEEYDLGSANGVGNGATGNSPLSITVPSDAVLGNTVMRVVARFTGTGGGTPESCASNTDGEVEDYRIIVQPSLSVGSSDFTKFEVFPNPTRNDINMIISTSEDVEFSLFDIRGRKVMENNFVNNSSVFNKTVNVSGIASGVYILTVESGSKKATKKIVIE